jgi:multidrug transporter EmrE-like cation transporter
MRDHFSSASPNGKWYRKYSVIRETSYLPNNMDRKLTMKPKLGILTIVGFAGAFVVHALAIGGIPVQVYFPIVWGFHVGAMVVFAAFVMNFSKAVGTKPQFRDFVAVFPKWALVLFAILQVYAIGNFLFSIGHLDGGSPGIQDGVYVLANRGKLIRKLSLSEYNYYQAMGLRGFSGHWLLFYLGPALYFLIGKVPESRKKPT